MRHEAPVLTIVDSSFETLATLLLIIVRMGNAYFGYWEVRSSMTDSQDNIHVRLIRRWMHLFNASGLLLFACSLGFFLLFLFEVHLGWTILTNNFCMITVQVLTGLYRSRVTVALNRIREDQHKVCASWS